jgi:RNA polymerase sigma-70 factor (ECF subfamily)
MSTGATARQPAAPIVDRPSPPAVPLRVAPSDDARTMRQLPQDLAAWYEEHREAIYRYVRFRVESRDAAEDVTSDVFLKSLRFLDRYEPSRSPPRPWLLGIARNAVADHRRTARRRASLHVSIDSVHDLVTDAPSAEERMIGEERLQRLLSCTRTLRAADQEVLSLRYGGGLSNHEIAQVLGITENAAAVRAHRALARLKAALVAEA